MQTVSPELVTSRLQWRYATKKFDSSRKIPAEIWAKLEDALILAPSSFGLQPWKFFVVTDPKVRAELLPHSWGQTQIVDASHLVVFAVKKGVGPADAEKLVQKTAEVRGVPVESLAGYKNMMAGTLTSKPEHEIDAWMTNQVFIALGVFMAVASMIGVDTCPMEGFIPAKYDEVLGLPAKGYHSVVLATAGYRSEDCKHAKVAKVRYHRDDVIEHI